ncbi:MAG: Na+:solute symporter, partial [Verrucomicrobiota bacterium]
RLTTIVLMGLAALLALVLENALQAFNILLSIGAGTGLIFLLRWFWWRLSAATEVAGMVGSFLVALFFEFGYEPLGGPALGPWQLPVSVATTTLLWLAVTFLTPPTDEATLRRFVRLVRPGGPGWGRIRRQLAAEGADASEYRPGLAQSLLLFAIGTFAVYFALFGTGLLIYGRLAGATFLLILAAAGGTFIIRQLLARREPADA